MKLLIASDLHGCSVSTRSLMIIFKDEQFDYLVLLGDLLNHGPRNTLPNGYDPQLTAALLNLCADKIVAIRGNCDSEVDQALLHFPLMADYNNLLLDGRRWFISDGHNYSPDNLPPLQSGDVFCCGHFHVPQITRQGEHWMVNPGSIAIPRGEYSSSFADYAGGTVRIRSLEDGKVLQQVDLPTGQFADCN